jgi:type IV pilus assembly protein PilA
MIKNNKKGLTLIELMLIIALTAIVLPMIATTLISGINTNSTYLNYTRQHDKIFEVTQRIRKNIQEASAYKEYSNLTEGNILILRFPDGSPDITWRFLNDSLSEKIGSTDFNIIISGIDTLESRFEDLASQENVIYFSIKPKATNVDKNKERNVVDPIITEFSVKYKEQIL